MDDINRDPFGMADGARKLAVDTVLKALIDHASATDPALRDRLISAVDAYLATLPDSEAERDFARWARSYIEGLARPDAG